VGFVFTFHQGEVHIIIKALLPLIAAIKYKLEHASGEQFGEQMAQVYKACKQELSRPTKQAKADSKNHRSIADGSQSKPSRSR
jgi:hypothetical protein